MCPYTVFQIILKDSQYVVRIQVLKLRLGVFRIFEVGCVSHIVRLSYSLDSTIKELIFLLSKMFTLTSNQIIHLEADKHKGSHLKNFLAKQLLEQMTNNVYFYHKFKVCLGNSYSNICIHVYGLRVVLFVAQAQSFITPSRGNYAPRLRFRAQTSPPNCNEVISAPCNSLLKLFIALFVLRNCWCKIVSPFCRQQPINNVYPYF